MRENGVYDRLIYEEPTAIDRPFVRSLPSEEKLEKIKSDLNNIRSSIRSRDSNTQKIWLRPTIMWKLECE